MSRNKIFSAFERRCYNITFALGSILHLIIGQLNFNFIDWQKLWLSAKFVSEGNSFYDQTILYHEGTNLGLPYQMPLMVYFLSIFAFIDSQRLARIAISGFIMGTAHLISRIVNERDKSKGVLIFYFNPMVIFLNYQGYFDTILLFFTLFSAYYLTQKNYPRAGFFLGIALLLKIYVIVLIVTYIIVFLVKGHFKKLRNFLLGNISCLGPSVGYFLYFYPDQFILKTLGYHLNREEITLSIMPFYLLFLWNSSYRNLLSYSILFGLILITVIRSNIQNDNFWYKISFSSLSFFLILNPILLPHYLMWHIIFAIPLISLNVDLKKRGIDPSFSAGLLYMIILLYSSNNYLWGRFGFKQQASSSGLQTLQITSIISLILTLLLLYRVFIHQTLEVK